MTIIHSYLEPIVFVDERSKRAHARSVYGSDFVIFLCFFIH